MQPPQTEFKFEYGSSTYSFIIIAHYIPYVYISSHADSVIFSNVNH